MHVLKIHDVKLDYKALAIAMGEGELLIFIFFLTTLLLLEEKEPCRASFLLFTTLAITTDFHLLVPLPSTKQTGFSLRTLYSHLHRDSCPLFQEEFTIYFSKKHPFHLRIKGKKNTMKQKNKKKNPQKCQKLTLTLLDCTAKALTHRIAKLRSMANDDSPAAPAGSSPGLGLPSPNKRKRGPPAAATTTKATTTAVGSNNNNNKNKKPAATVTTTANKRPNAAATAKKGAEKKTKNGNGNVGGDVVIERSEEEDDDDDEDEGEDEKVTKGKNKNKKVKLEQTVHAEEDSGEESSA